MNINTDTLVSMTEANQNFSKVARLVDKKGMAVILKNNSPKYLVIEFDEADKLVMASDDDVSKLSEKIIEKNKIVYEELAK